MIGYIYRFKNTANGKCYIGQTIDIVRRYKRHLADAKKINNKFYNAVIKHGIDSFKFEVLFTVLDADDLNEIEQYFISEYDSFANGYNSNTGGKSAFGFKHSEETKRKLSDQKKRYNPQKGKPLTEEHKERIASKMRGELGHFYGKTHTLETKRRISAANKGKIIPEDIRLKMSVSHVGEKNSMYGISRPEIGQNNKEFKGYKLQYDNEIFRSMRDLAKHLGKSRSVVKRLIKEGVVKLLDNPKTTN